MLLLASTGCHRQALFTPWRPRAQLRLELSSSSRRSLLTLAIETSCDDTCVALLSTGTNPPTNRPYARLLFHEKITADNAKYRGIHPLQSLESHQAELPGLVRRALQTSVNADHRIIPASKLTTSPDGVVIKPELIAVTRGPGMRSSLSAGLDLAKGLALAWQVPLVGVHHMQAHALTPRLVSAMAAAKQQGAGNEASNVRLAILRPKDMEPKFPFLSLLVSGGHTLLLHSKSLIEHKTLASTCDIAIGDAVDKLARVILPKETILQAQDTSYGRVLEQFAFPSSPDGSPVDYEYQAPPRRHEELERRISLYGWGLAAPLAETKSGKKSWNMEYSFSGLDSSVRRIVKARGETMNEDERRLLAREAMRVAFEHLASRVVMALKASEGGIETLVLSGGVAANLFLRHVLRKFLDVRGYGHVELVFPPVELCTDNAAMIAWAGVEMFEAGWKSDLGCLPERKWPLDEAEGGEGFMGVGGWVRRKGRQD